MDHRRLTSTATEAAQRHAEYRSAFDSYIQQAEAYALDVGRHPNTSAREKATARLDVMSDIVTRLLQTVAFVRLQLAYDHARKVIAAWIVVAAAGAVTFGWATTGGSATPPAPDLTDAPAAAILRPGDDSTKELNRQLSAGCQIKSGAPVPVIVLATETAGSNKALRIVTVPVAGCTPARLLAPFDEVTAS